MVLQKKTSISLMLVAVSVIAAGSLGSSYAQESGMSLTATAQDGSDTITVTGQTGSTLNDVSILVEAPNRNVISVAQVSPDANGEFDVDIKIGGEFWGQDGMYTITAQQSSSSLYKLSVKVQVADGAAFSTDVTQSTLGNTMTGGIVSHEAQGLVLTADAVVGSDTITIIGNTDRMQHPITLKVMAPNGNVISVYQAYPDADGDFSVDIVTGSDLWSQDGYHTITAQQGNNPNYRASVQVDILDGLVIPEFGAVAALVLAAAIVSIIAVSARSRLSIMPKH